MSPRREISPMAMHVANVCKLESGLIYIPDFSWIAAVQQQGVASFKDKEEAMWAIHMIRLFLRPRPRLVMAWNSIRGDALVQVRIKHRHIGYMLRLEHQPELQRRITSHEQLQVGH